MQTNHRSVTRGSEGSSVGGGEVGQVDTSRTLGRNETEREKERYRKTIASPCCACKTGREGVERKVIAILLFFFATLVPSSRFL